jgi:3-hydroxymyristoyl/3-hydroxydecanoyl-(acyl carrier protein) dehydratase
MNESVVSTFMVPADHPALAGHFPGRPVVPGVVLLEATLAAVGGSGAWTLQSIPTAKFLQPVLPGEQIELRIELLAEEPARVRARFRARRAAVLVFEGSLLFTTGEAA